MAKMFGSESDWRTLARIAKVFVVTAGCLYGLGHGCVTVAGWTPTDSEVSGAEVRGAELVKKKQLERQLEQREAAAAAEALQGMLDRGEIQQPEPGVLVIPVRR